jgi:GNAT superfamily N-acetyltransferase
MTTELAGPRLEIQVLPSARAVDAALMTEVTELINRVYEVGEEGLWQPGARRTTVAEVAELVRAGEIALARHSGDLVGCVRVQRLDADTGEFGMLAADLDRRGLGIGRELVLFAENRCRDEGLTSMQLELLVPKAWTHPVKEFLNAWYTRIGYRVERTGTIDEAYPALAPRLAIECNFVIYRKSLAS